MWLCAVILATSFIIIMKDREGERSHEITANQRLTVARKRYRSEVLEYSIGIVSPLSNLGSASFAVMPIIAMYNRFLLSFGRKSAIVYASNGRPLFKSIIRYCGVHTFRGQQSTKQTQEHESDIAKWYRNKAVFVTGATGYMGKVLVEKLLRSCPEIGPIYVLVRKKKNMLPSDRINEIMTCRAFEEVRSLETSRKNRLVPISGDVSLPDLGISAEDRRLLQETVSVVFHLAATVRFDEPLKTAVAMNTEGTRVLLELCRSMTSLCSIVYVSTAYSNCIHPVIEERVYPPPADPNLVKNCVEGLNDNLLELVVPRLIGDHANTYTFSKALAEHVVAGYSTELPVVIVRPSIVTAAWREPIPGWVDSYGGPTIVMVASGKGFLKKLHGKGQLVADLIPVDVCINLIIAAAWEIGNRKGTKLVPNVRVYNCVSGPFKPISWGEFSLTIDSSTKKYPMSNFFTSPKLTVTDSRLKLTLSNLLEGMLPAILADTFIRIFGGKPRFQHYQREVNKTMEMITYFSFHEFEFRGDNVRELKRCLNPTDRDIFNFDLTEMNWEEYTATYFLGIRRYLMNETDDTIPVARQQIAKRALITKAVQIGVLAIVVAFSFQNYSPNIIESYQTWINL